VPQSHASLSPLVSPSPPLPTCIRAHSGASASGRIRAHPHSGASPTASQSGASGRIRAHPHLGAFGRIRIWAHLGASASGRIRAHPPQPRSQAHPP
jgi:hypothetical protein